MRCRGFRIGASGLIAAVALLVPAAVHPEAQLPLPELVVEPVVSKKEYDTIEREKADLEKHVKELESEVVKQREAAAELISKLREAEAQARKAEEDLAKFKSARQPNPKAKKKDDMDTTSNRGLKTFDRPDDASNSTRRSFEPEMVLIEGGAFEMPCVSARSQAPAWEPS